MRNIYFVILVCGLSFISCQNATLPKTSGLVEYSTTAYGVWHKDAKPVWRLSAKIWYHDSMAIEERARLNFVTDTNQVTTTTIDIVNYRFNDLRARSVYVYKNFSDTAKVISTYSLDDTTVEVIGGWGFNIKRENAGKPASLPDTVISATNYKRLRTVAIRNGILGISTFYFQCNIPHSLFSLDLNFSKKIGCPCLKHLTEFPELKSSVLLEVNYVRDSLTEKEKSVFKAWEKYAKEHPVHATNPIGSKTNLKEISH